MEGRGFESTVAFLVEQRDTCEGENRVAYHICGASVMNGTVLEVAIVLRPGSP